MLYGQSSIHTNSNIPPATVMPPFPAGAANNGLSVDPITGLIVLGNDFPGITAALLSIREIPMGAFPIVFSSNVLGGLAILNPISFSITHPGSANGVTLSCGPLAGRIAINSDSTIPGGSPPLIRFHDPLFQDTNMYNLAGNFVIETAAGTPSLALDFTNGNYDMGDVNGIANNTTISVDDGAGQVIANAINGLRSSTTIRTADPGSGSADWRLGTVVVAASVLDATQYVEVMIGGVVLKLALIQ